MFRGVCVTISCQDKQANSEYQSDAPLYHNAWIACLSLGAIWLAVLIIQTFTFKWFNYCLAKKRENNVEIESQELFTDSKGKKHRYYW